MRRLLFWFVLPVSALLVLPPLWYTLFPVSVTPLAATGRRVEVAPGVSVHVSDRGVGRPVVLVHGHPGCGDDWALVAEALAQRGHRAIAYDRVGYGRSDPRRHSPFMVAANADDLLALMAAEDLKDAIVVGWSYGGGTAIVAAKKDASRIARLVLVGSVGPGIENRPTPPRWVLGLMVRGGLQWLARVPPLSLRLRESLATQAFRPQPLAPGYVEHLSANFAGPHTLESFASEGRDLDGSADLDPAPLDLPILIVQGDGDELVPPYVAEALHRRARNSELWSIEGGGHMLPLTMALALAERIAAL